MTTRCLLSSNMCMIKHRNSLDFFLIYEISFSSTTNGTVVIEDFYRLYSIYSYYKILAIFPVLYNIILLLLYFIHSINTL